MVNILPVNIEFGGRGGAEAAFEAVAEQIFAPPHSGFNWQNFVHQPSPEGVGSRYLICVGHVSAHLGGWDSRAQSGTITPSLYPNIFKKVRPVVSFHGHSPLQVRPPSPADMGRAATEMHTATLKAVCWGSLTPCPGPHVYRSVLGRHWIWIWSGPSARTKKRRGPIYALHTTPSLPIFLPAALPPIRCPSLALPLIGTPSPLLRCPSSPNQASRRSSYGPIATA